MAHDTRSPLQRREVRSAQEAGPETLTGSRAASSWPKRSPANNVTVYLAELAAASGWLEHRAYVDDEQAFSYGDVHTAIASSATLLAERGATEGEPVLIATHDRIGFVLAFLGAARLGAIAVPVNPRLAAKDYAFMIADAKPRLIVCEEHLQGLFPGLPVLVVDDLEREGPTSTPCPPASLPPNALLYGQYTSGTTGRPKLVLHRHSDVAHHAVAIRAILEPTPDDVFYSVSRAYFSYGLGNSVLCVLSTGVSAILSRELPTIEAVTRLMERHRPTVLFAVPTFYAVLLAEGRPDAFHCLRAGLSAGEALARALQERASQFLDAPVLNGLGSTEVGHLFIANTLTDCRPGTFGRILPGYELAVRDEQRRPVANGQVGALWVRGPTLMVGYHNRPEENARALVDDWLCTGDRVSVDKDGLVHHFGRLDDLEMVGGITVSPIEIEATIASHPAVEDVAVVALADEIGASRLRAFVVLAPGAAPSEALEAELLGLVRANLVAYMVPRSVHFVDALPRTPSGKLQRHVLRTGWSRWVSSSDLP
jgi:fatty acid CoA ligase FadD22